MQIYGVRFHYFMRFGEKNNSIVFDLSPEQKEQLQKGETTLDALYDQMRADPVNYIAEIKRQGITNMLGIMGSTDGNADRSNGSGKSSTMEGICYVNYDRIVRKNVNTDKTEKAGLSVVSRINGQLHPDMQDSYVEEILEDAGSIYRIKRGRTFSKNQKSNTPYVEFECYNEDKVDSLSGHRTSDTNESIDAMMPMDYDLFVNSVMFAQNDAGKFLTGTDKTRKEMITSLLRVEELVASCLEVIRNQKNTKDKELNALRVKIGIIESRIAQMKSVKEYQDAIALHEDHLKTIDAQVTEYDKQIDALSHSSQLSVIDNIKVEGKKIKDELLPKQDELAKEIEPWKKLIAEDEEIRTKKSEVLHDLEQKHVEIGQEIIELNRLVSKVDKKTKQATLDKAGQYKSALPKYESLIQELEAKQHDLASKIGFARGLLDTLESEKLELESEIQNVDGDKFICSKCKSQVTRAHIENEISEINKKLDAQKLSLERLLDAEAKTNTRSVEAKRRKRLIDDAIKESNKIELELKELDGNLKIVKRMESEKSEIVRQQGVVKKELEALVKKIDAHRKKIEEVKAKSESDIASLKNRLDELAQQLIKAQQDAKGVTDKIDRLKLNKKASDDEKKTIHTSIGGMKKDIETVDKETCTLSELNKQIEVESVTLNRLLMLEDVFGLDGIQTRIVKKYLPLLNVYIKEFLDILSDGEMLVKLVINDRSKVDITIDGGTADTFPMLSGGEKMIVRLAVDIGLALLSFSRSAQKPEIICLDEIFGPLDNARTDAVFKVLQKLQDRFNRVLVISHKSEIKDIIGTNILIEKSSGMSGMSEIIGIT